MSEEHHLGEDLALLALDDPQAIARHAAHLAGCTECQRAVDEAQRVMVALVMPVDAPSAAFDRALWARLDAVDAEGSSSWWARIGGGWTWPAWGLVAAGATAAVVGVVALGTWDRGGGGADPSTMRMLASVEDVELTENLDLLGDLDLVEELDAIEDLDAIETLDEGSPG